MNNPVRILLRVPVPWVFVLCYLLGVALEHFHHTPVSALGDKLSLTAGYILFIAGAIIAGWGLYLFRSAGTTTVPGRLSAQFVTSGPYRFTRNPMYVGLTLAYLGEAGFLRQAWPLATLPLVLAYVNWIVIPLEEEKLTAVFGSQYRYYKTQVRRWL